MGLEKEIKGRAKEAEGKLKEGAGKVTDDKKLEAEGTVTFDFSAGRQSSSQASSSP